MIVSNTGTAAARGRQARRHRADRLGRLVRPADVAKRQAQRDGPGDGDRQAQQDAVAGDYALTVRSSAGSQSSNVDLRYTLEGSRTLGFVAIGVIVVAFARPRRRVRPVRPAMT